MKRSAKQLRLAADGILIKKGKILLVQRRFPPFSGSWALPGGMVEYGETIEKAVVREVFEETGLSTKVANLIGVYSDPKRDPRGQVVSISYLLKSPKGSLKTSIETPKLGWWPLRNLPKLAFDHKKIIRDALRL